MSVSLFTYYGDSRSLKRIITGILKSGTAQQIQKINYCQDFHLEGKDIKKSETKILITHSDNEDKLLQFVSKFPEIKKIQ